MPADLLWWGLKRAPPGTDRVNVLWVFFATTAGLMIIKLDTSKAPDGSFIEIKS